MNPITRMFYLGLAACIFPPAFGWGWLAYGLDAAIDEVPEIFSESFWADPDRVLAMHDPGSRAAREG